MQTDRILVEGLNQSCKPDAVYEKHGHRNPILAECVQELVLKQLALFAHLRAAARQGERHFIKRSIVPYRAGMPRTGAPAIHHSVSALQGSALARGERPFVRNPACSRGVEKVHGSGFPVNRFPGVVDWRTSPWLFNTC